MKIARGCRKKKWHIKKSISDDIQRKQATCHKNPSIMKEGESDSRDTVMKGQTLGESIAKNC
jgi:hypothetical protein